MRVCVLGSSSSGNSIFVSDGETRVLIDTGNLPVLRYIQPSLAAIGEDWQDLDAILVSHGHGDHLNANTFGVAARTATPVYAPARVAAWLGGPHAARLPWRHLAPCLERGLVRTLDGALTIGTLGISTCPLPHDSEPTLGFVLTGRDGRRVGVATDLGHVPKAVAAHLRDCDALVLEANHDVAMERESGRDEALIERNLGPYGHLSNAQCAAALCAIVGANRRRPECVFLAHLSRDCNHPDLACETVGAALAAAGLGDLRTEPTFPRSPSKVAQM
jgi:phosphoribosyl 1,2-cyclic phosphodiesterase